MPDHASVAGIEASQIPVCRFREILIWPLALHLRPAPIKASATQDQVTEAIDHLTFGRNGQRTKWLPVDDPSKHIAAPGEGPELALWRAHRYQEAVYFHDFVQSFLFSPRYERNQAARDQHQPDPAPFRLFHRTDVTGAVVQLGAAKGQTPKQIRLKVERLNLYLFRSGAAILVLEMLGERSPVQHLHLADVQNFLERFRRAYVPYAEQTQDHRLVPPASLVVSGVTWQLRDGTEKNYPVDEAVVAELIKRYLDCTEDDADTGVQRRSPPLFPHWEWLLDNALPLASDRPDAARKARWHHVVDERMPTISTVSVSATDAAITDERHYFNATRPGDLVRLCYADGAGKAEWPYDPAFLKNFESDHLYQAFRDQGTLFLVSGYAFTAYGAGWFFDNIVAELHMRRHYFQIGLLAHLELASLLSFSSRISRAVAEFRADTHAPERLELVMQSIQEEYLQFLHRFRFTGASNHLQAQELTALWRRHLRLPEIFGDLHTEITSATSYLFNRATSRGAAVAERLQMIGLFGVVFGLSFSLLGTPVFAKDSPAGILLSLVGVLTAAAWTALAGLCLLERDRQRALGQSAAPAEPSAGSLGQLARGLFAGDGLPTPTRTARTWMARLALVLTGVTVVIWLSKRAWTPA
jgi:hypothetical protein